MPPLVPLIKINEASKIKINSHHTLSLRGKRFFIVIASEPSGDEAFSRERSVAGGNLLDCGACPE